MRLRLIAGAFLLIIVGALLLRAYHFSDWLYFEADQTRNANNAIDALEDFKELPLLGPKAGGTNFHLGPVSYYFEYLSGLIFGTNHPAVFAFPNFFFLLLSIPLFFYFLRQFFNKEISLWVTALFSFSYLITQYSRFSWNPNAIIFFGLLFVLALYKISTEEDREKAGFWLLSVGLSYGVSSQLHTLALLGYPLAALIFWMFNRPTKINWKFWLGAVAIVAVLYTPLIVYDIKNQGANSREFLGAFSAKGEKRALTEKLNKVSEIYGENYVLTISSFNNKELKNADLIGCLFIIFSVVVLGGLIFNRKIKNKSALSEEQRRFLLLNLISFLVFGLAHFQLAFDVDQPRFWFPVFFLPFVLLGLILSLSWHSKIGRKAAYTIIFILIIVNLTATANWYMGMGKQDGKNRLWRKTTTSTLIQNDFIGYGQMREAAQWIKKESQAGAGKACFNAPSTYLASYKYIFDNEYPDFDAKRINSTIEMNLVETCDIFIIDHSGNSKAEIEEKFARKEINLSLMEGGKFGLVLVWKVKLEDSR